MHWAHPRTGCALFDWRVARVQRPPNPAAATEIDRVSGGATLQPASVVHDRLSVEESKKAALAQRLEKSFANSHPFDYYGYFG